MIFIYLIAETAVGDPSINIQKSQNIYVEKKKKRKDMEPSKKSQNDKAINVAGQDRGHAVQ